MPDHAFHMMKLRHAGKKPPEIGIFEFESSRENGVNRRNHEFAVWMAERSACLPRKTPTAPLAGDWFLSSYSGWKADGSFRLGPPPPDADGKRRFLVPESALNDADRYSAFFTLFPEFAEAFVSFEDEQSRQLMILILLRRILGPERTTLNISDAEYAAWTQQLAPFLVRQKTCSVECARMTMDEYDLNPAGMPIRVNTSRSSLLAHLFLRQYEFKRGDSRADGVHQGFASGLPFLAGSLPRLRTRNNAFRHRAVALF